MCLRFGLGRTKADPYTEEVSPFLKSSRVGIGTLEILSHITLIYPLALLGNGENDIRGCSLLWLDPWLSH